MDKSQRSKNSWWQTLPGALTAVAATATAVASLIGVLHQAGWFVGGDDGKKSVPLCSAHAGYPRGRWALGANATDPDQYATFATFTRPDGGTWLPNTGQGTFEAIPVPSPGAEVLIRFQTNSGDYSSTNRLVVSSDGCRMDGTFLDSQGRSGVARYTYEMR